METVQLSGEAPPVKPEQAMSRALFKQAVEVAAEASTQFAFGPVAQFACQKLKGVLRPGPATVPSNELGPLPPSTITRPVVFVPGFHTPMHRFDPLVEKLTENGRNGGQPVWVKEGAFYEDRECCRPARNLSSESRVFVTAFSRPNLPPRRGAAEMRENLAAIEALTGHGKIDAAAFSLGGLISRRYVDDGGTQIGKLQMIGTPNHGSGLAKMSKALLDGKDSGYDVDLLLSLKNLTSEDRAALDVLDPGSTELASLNERWPEQRSRLESVRHFGSDLKLTVGSRYLLSATKGDGIVSRSSLELEGLPMRMLEDKKYALHGNLITSPELYDELQDHFGWR